MKKERYYLGCPHCRGKVDKITEVQEVYVYSELTVYKFNCPNCGIEIDNALLEPFKVEDFGYEF